MNTRQRNREAHGQNPTPQVENGGSHDELDALRQKAGGLLNAGDAAIEETVSSDSEGFLHATPQKGGQ